MPYSVSSWFVDQCALENPPVKRRLLIAGSDYTDYVGRWPSVSRKWNDLRAMSVSIQLSNEDQTFNFFRTNKTTLRSSIQLQIGFTHPTSGDEFITAFAGTSERVSFESGAVNLTVSDKLKQLSERVVGASNSPAVFSSSIMLPSDIAWTLCTCYGGLSSIQSTSNPDINYQSFLDFASVLSFDNVLMGGRFEGQKVAEGLRKIADMTQAAIVLVEDKISFYRFSTANSFVSSLSTDHVKDISLTIDDLDMVNKQWVYGDYRVESKYWPLAVFDTRSASVSSFGLREQVMKDESVWYVTSAAAINMAQRVMSTAGLPYDRVTLSTPLVPLFKQIGEIIAVSDALIGNSSGYRIMGYNLNLEDGSMKMELDASQLVMPFTLDVSELDGPDVLN